MRTSPMVTNRGSASVREHDPSSLLKLPFDVILALCSLVDPIDIVNFLSTCKALRSHFPEESIWRMLSLRCGVVDLTFFGDRTWFQVYSQLLHTFAPLLGLWASDHPFRGNIMECRINEDGEWHGIICEVWKFDGPDRENAGLYEPSLPRYYESFRIPLDPVGSNPPRLRSASSVVWRIHDRQLQDWKKEGEIHRPSLHFLAPAQYATAVCSIRSNATDCNTHPYFPPKDLSVPWYDQARGFPRLGQEPSDDIVLSEISIEDLRFIGAERTRHLTPPAISVYPPCGLFDPLRLHDPCHRPLGQDLFVGGRRRRSTGEPVFGRYYPITYPVTYPSPISLARHPNDPNWHPASLEGLWLGSYGPNGTEVLYLEWRESANIVRAWKVTGDENVPRGVVSWELDFTFKSEATAVSSLEAFAGLDPGSCMFMWGRGHICSAGYPSKHRREMGIMVAIVREDDIRILWGVANGAFRYRRYKGRCVSSEEEVQPGVRQSQLGYGEP
ncbi:unnamed protein product [Somion occarium]